MKFDKFFMYHMPLNTLIVSGKKIDEDIRLGEIMFKIKKKKSKILFNFELNWNRKSLVYYLFRVFSNISAMIFNYTNI